ncbi:MAG: tetratricopeptide repeat protein, partial [Chloroflexota bacterium]
MIDLLSLISTLNDSNYIAEIDDGLKLYRGALLDGFYLDDAPQFNEWLLIEQEQLRHRVTSTYRQIITVYTADNELKRGINVAERWLTLDPLDEEPLRFLMSLLKADNQLDRAIQIFEYSQQRLLEELEVEPEPETIGLSQEILKIKENNMVAFPNHLDLQSNLNWPDRGSLAELGPLPIHSLLPYQRNIDFTGRSHSLLFIAESLLPWPYQNETTRRTVAITGMGGIGKTQLAVEFCFRYGRFFEGGVYWISFADTENVVDEILAIGGEKGMGLYQNKDGLGRTDKIGRIQKAWQEPISRLLIFDNCEDERLLSEWLPVVGGTRVLVTSQRANWARALQIKERPLPPLDHDESVALLQKLVPSLKTNQATDISDALGHLPLALHLAGSFLSRYRQITPSQYLQQLQEIGLYKHPSLQGRGSDYSPTGHELNIFRTFAINLERLNPQNEIDSQARLLLACASQFAPSEPVERQLLVEIISDEDDLFSQLTAEDALNRLITLGFLRSNEARTITIHQLLVIYANEILEEREKAQQLVETHIWEKIDSVWTNEFSLANLPIAPRHLHHITDAALTRNEIVAAKLAHVWGQYLLDRKTFETSQSYLETALTILKANGFEKHLELADLHLSLGVFHWQVKSIQTAWPHLLQANQIYEALVGEVHPKMANSLSLLGMLCNELSDYKNGQRYFERALAIYDQLPNPNPVEVAKTYYRLGTLHNRNGNYKESIGLLERALAIRNERLPANHVDIIQTLNALGAGSFYQGDYPKSISYIEQAYHLYKAEFGEESLYTAMALNNLGATLIQMQDYERAENSLRQAIALRQRLLGEGNVRLGATYSSLGHLFLKIGNFQDAGKYLEMALKIQQAKQPKVDKTANSLNYLGDLYLQLNEPEKAKPVLEEALAIRKEIYP